MNSAAAVPWQLFAHVLRHRNVAASAGAQVLVVVRVARARSQAVVTVGQCYPRTCCSHACHTPAPPQQLSTLQDLTPHYHVPGTTQYMCLAQPRRTPPTLPSFTRHTAPTHARTTTRARVYRFSCTTDAPTNARPLPAPTTAVLGLNQLRACSTPRPAAACAVAAQAGPRTPLQLKVPPLPPAATPSGTLAFCAAACAAAGGAAAAATAAACLPACCAPSA